MVAVLMPAQANAAATKTAIPTSFLICCVLSPEKDAQFANDRHSHTDALYRSLYINVRTRPNLPKKMEKFSKNVLRRGANSC
jgi:hypothetical protein